MGDQQTENIKIDTKVVEKWLSIIDKNDDISIICHDQPDPDCLASAFAIQTLAQSKGKNAVIYYGGEIPYTQNSVMMNVLNISAIKLEVDEDNEEESTQQIKDNIKKSCVIVVDTSANFGKENNTGVFAFLEKDRKPDAVIDHHTINPCIDCPMYINKQYGACSTILLEMLTGLNIPISKGLATALYLGISTDTADLKSEGTVQNDIDAMDFLRSIMDVELLRKIYDYPKPLALLELRRRAYSNFCISGNNLTISNVGIVNPQQRALLAKLCEEMLEVESIDSALVMGLVDEGFDKPKFLIASFRTGVLGINVSQFIQKIFGKKYGGGRRGAGAAKVPLDDKISAVIDFAKRQENGAVRIEQLVAPFFEYYADKARTEKSNI
jgi:nanoRNase/pAp phosphatase (c-di-AMP/oligoRNAs hydrolase)